MKKHICIKPANILVCVLCALIFVQPAHAGRVPLVYLSELSAIQKTLTLIRREYIDDHIDGDALIQGAIRGMLRSLEDPYSRYVDAEQFKKSMETMSGEFGGVGIIVTRRDEKISVISPVRNTPAFRAGILPGDYILSIDGESTEDMCISHAVDMLRGDLNTAVRLEMMRFEDSELYEVELIRENVQVKSIDTSGVVDEIIGYMRISSFNEETASELDRHLETFRTQGIRAIILDLRNNPGGLLEAAVAASQRFLDYGEIVSVRDRHNTITSYTASPPSEQDMSLVVLINRGSASAAEILAGAIQDNKRGLVIGARSFGKGCVQSVVPMDDGSAIILTTGWYFTPSGNSIHETGLEPDIMVKVKDPVSLTQQEIESEKERMRTILDQAVIDREKGLLPVIEPGKYDTQFQSAVQMLKASMVLEMGAGTIRKDIAAGNH